MDSDSSGDGNANLSPPSRLSRRRWLKRAALAAGGLAAACMLDALMIEPYWLELVERDLPIARLPARWQGISLAQISDIHVGHQVRDAYLLSSFERVAERKPDIVALTGDFLSLNRDGRAPFEQVERICRNLPRGRTATLAILGNHDYGIRWREPAVAAEVATILRGCGVRVLRNESADLDGLQIVGMDDLWAGQCDVAGALARSQPKGSRIVLCHNPDGVDRGGWGDYEGWILSGHTHGGQCKPPFLPPPFTSVANRRYVAGEVDLGDGRRLYINRALGHTLRVRFNVRPEITLFRLTQA